MSDELFFDGARYISAGDAAGISGLTRDYVARLAREGKVAGRQVGRQWYVGKESMSAFLVGQEYASMQRRGAMIRERQQEWGRMQAISSPEKKIPASTAPQKPASIHLPASPSNNEDLHRKLTEAAMRGSARAVSKATAIATNASAQMPLYAVTPGVELLHKLAAAVFALVLIVGLYGAGGSFVATSPDFIPDAHISPQIELGAAAGLVGGTFSEIAGTLRAGVSAFLAPLSGVHLAQSNAAPDAVSLAAAAASAASPSAGAVVAQPTQAAPDTAAASAYQSPAGAVAMAVAFSGAQVAYGDLVAYDPGTNTYSLTSGPNDPNIYGVVVQSPALLFQPGSSASVPVTSSGTALVNVTLENGAIKPGDPLTSSSIPGKARRANPGEHVIGTAAEAFSGQSGVQLQIPGGSKVLSGTISVDVNVAGNAPASASSAQCSSLTCQLFGVVDPTLARALIRYLLAALIAMLSLTLAFRSFMSDANYGVVSMGRNPLASSSIRSMVLLNAFLALAIASAGLFAAMVVLFASA
jgi:hypothetical protein